LPAAIFGASANPENSLIYEVEETRFFALSEDDTSTAPVDDHRCVLEEMFLLLAREQISDGYRLDARSVEWSRAKPQARSTRTAAAGRRGTSLRFGELQDRTNLGCAEIYRIPLQVPQPFPAMCTPPFGSEQMYPTVSVYTNCDIMAQRMAKTSFYCALVRI
jgi:hypothetical protein